MGESDGAQPNGVPGKTAFRLAPKSSAKSLKRKAVALLESEDVPAPESQGQAHSQASPTTSPLSSAEHQASSSRPDPPQESDAHGELSRAGAPGTAGSNLDSFLDGLLDTTSPAVATPDSEEIEDASKAPSRSSSRPTKPANKLSKITTEFATYPFTKTLYQQSSEQLAGESTAEAAEGYRKQQGIDVQGEEEAASLLPVSTWESAALPMPMMRVLERQNYETPTPIQAQALPIIMSGHDMLGIAPTGSGKTAAYVIPLTRHLAANLETYQRAGSRGPFALVLVPTRELCIQVHQELLSWTQSLRLHALSCYGGSDISSQISALVNNKCHVLVATPGRLIDLLAANNGRVMSLGAVTFLVVDETDRMFDLGFGPQVRKIVESVRRDRQTVVFSATMPSNLESFVRRILDRPAKVIVDASRGSTSGRIPQLVSQSVLVTESEDEKFIELLNTLSRVQKAGGSQAKTPLAIVFVNTQATADLLALRLGTRSVLCRALHGGMDQRDRDEVITDFRSGEIPVLVATSVAARGLDVRGLKAVVNYDAASHLEDYVHRAGRTGRAGESGECITLLLATQEKEAFQLAQVLDATGVPKQMADHFAATHRQEIGSAKSKWLGFGGHGLTRLDSKRELTKSIEQDALLQDAALAASKQGTPEIDDSVAKKVGKNAYTARLGINEASKEARLAMTAVSRQGDLMERFGVSLTIKGTYYANPHPGTSDERKLHLLIEGNDRNNVQSAFAEMLGLMESKNAEAGSQGRYSAF